MVGVGADEVVGAEELRVSGGFEAGGERVAGERDGVTGAECGELPACGSEGVERAGFGEEVGARAQGVGGGDRKCEGEVAEARAAGAEAAHPRGFGAEGDFGGAQVFRRRDLDDEERVGFEAVGIDGGHLDLFGGGPLDGAGFEAFGERPLEIGGDAGEAGVFPVGVVASVVVDEEADGERFARGDAGGFGDEFDVEAGALVGGWVGAERGGGEQGEKQQESPHGES